MRPKAEDRRAARNGDEACKYPNIAAHRGCAVGWLRGFGTADLDPSCVRFQSSGYRRSTLHDRHRSAVDDGEYRVRDRLSNCRYLLLELLFHRAALQFPNEDYGRYDGGHCLRIDGRDYHHPCRASAQIGRSGGAEKPTSGHHRHNSSNGLEYFAKRLVRL